MRVMLRRTWFAPGGNRYRASSQGVEVPDGLKDFLPPDAVIIGKDGKPGKETVSGDPVALSQLAHSLNPPLEPPVPLSAGGHGSLQLSSERDARSVHVVENVDDPALGTDDSLRHSADKKPAKK